MNLVERAVTAVVVILAVRNVASNAKINVFHFKTLRTLIMGHMVKIIL